MHAADAAETKLRSAELMLWCWCFMGRNSGAGNVTDICMSETQFRRLSMTVRAAVPQVELTKLGSFGA